MSVRAGDIADHLIDLQQSELIVDRCADILDTASLDTTESLTSRRRPA